MPQAGLRPGRTAWQRRVESGVSGGVQVESQWQGCACVYAHSGTAGQSSLLQGTLGWGWVRGGGRGRGGAAGKISKPLPHGLQCWAGLSEPSG